jgi:hypothetical protein
MSGSTGSRSIARLLVVIQVFLLVASLFAPMATRAADPSADPSASPSAEPTPAPTPDPTPEPTPAPTAEPTAAPTAEPTAPPTSAPTAEPTQAPPAYAPSGPASIASDQADYPPGGTVTLTGSNWYAGESVHIFVNDDLGSSWSRNVDILADAAGQISDSFTLPDWFVATYSVVATGELSGTTTSTFTDGNVNIKTSGTDTEEALITWRRFANTTCTGGGIVGENGTISASTTSGTGIPSGAATGQSLRLTTGSITGYTFVNWTGSGGFVSTSANPICLPGSGSTQNLQVNYAANTNTAPVAVDDSYPATEDTTLTVVAPGVLGNDTDVDGNPLTAVLGTGPTAAQGTLTLNANGSFTFVPAANFNGPVTFTYRANDGTANSNLATVTITVAAVNDAPVVTVSGDFSAVNEGVTRIYTYSVTDVDSASPTVTESCGTGATYIPDATANSFACKFLDGPGSSTVNVTADDGDPTNNIGDDPHTVTINNVAPTATFAASSPVSEGSPSSLSLTSPIDPSSADTTAGFKYSFACDPAVILPTTYAGAGSVSTVTCSYGDNGTYTVRGRIFDKDSGYTTYTTTVTVTNVNPTLNSPVFTYNPFTGFATATISYSDPGWLDTFSATFTWGDGSTSTGALASPTNSPPSATGTFTASHTYAVGCVSVAPSVVVTDDDGGSASYTYPGGIQHYTVAFQAPIQDGARNIVKQGNVIPVKLVITDCSGNPVLGKSLSIGYIAGDVYNDDDAGLLNLTESVASADTNGWMRQVDSQYMYNLATKSLNPNMPYTVVVREPLTNQFVASFVIQTKK